MSYRDLNRRLEVTLGALSRIPLWTSHRKLRHPKAPNVLLILTDDVGFGATSTFGGPIPTPTFDRLAANGLRYTAFHTTALPLARREPGL